MRIRGSPSRPPVGPPPAGSGRRTTPPGPPGRVGPLWSAPAHRLAWCLVAEGGRADPGEAVRWARVAVAAEPGNALYHSILGAALYRAGRFRDAADELRANILRQPRGIAPDSAGLDWLFLAMCRRRMGQADAARAALAEALRWRAEAPPLALTILLFPRFLREAESLLAATLPDLPADVFGR